MSLLSFDDQWLNVLSHPLEEANINSNLVKIQNLLCKLVMADLGWFCTTFVKHGKHTIMAYYNNEWPLPSYQYWYDIDQEMKYQNFPI